jgi:hypothetical protein
MTVCGTAAGNRIPLGSRQFSSLRRVSSSVAPGSTSVASNFELIFKVIGTLLGRRSDVFTRNAGVGPTTSGTEEIPRLSKCGVENLNFRPLALHTPFLVIIHESVSNGTKLERQTNILRSISDTKCRPDDAIDFPPTDSRTFRRQIDEIGGSPPDA